MIPRPHLGLLVGLLWVASPGWCFNLETREAKVFAFPDQKQPQDREPYFGFAVALQKHHTDESAWLVVGSPRANSTKFEPGIKEPGTVFKCNLNGGRCEELKLDKDYGNGNLHTYSSSWYKNFKAGGWVGGALDTQPTYASDRQTTAVCSPRWINQEDRYYESETYRMNGVCYWLDDSLPVTPAHKMMPLNGNQVLRVSGRNIFYYYHGQVGFSVHFTSNPTEMIMGAPGVLNWGGTVVRATDLSGNVGSTYRSSRRQQVTDDHFFSKFIVPNPYFIHETEDFDLMGYAVTSGKYLNTEELLYGSGAPRGANTFGKVIIFSFPMKDHAALNVRQEMVGQQLGAYFGASLTSADINGDGLSDLVVGAPMFMQANRPDVGKVFVYLSSMRSERLQQASTTYHGSNVINARFGTTLASLGDLNNDHYEDFAVGAPFEGDGAVYVILGSKGDLPMTHSQRLAAESFSGGLRGFGMALSRGIDVDGNNYPDLAVGSFLSGHAVVVRSRPVARLTSSLTASPSTIQLSDDEFQIRVCIQFRGMGVPSQIDVNGTLTLDPMFARASFPSSNSVMNFAEKLDLQHQDRNCKNYTAKVMNLRQNPHEPIELRLDFELVESDNKLLIDQPVADPTTTRGGISRVSIATGCKRFLNKTCHTDMRLEASFLDYKFGESLIIGDDMRPKFNVIVFNTDEPAFLPIMTAKVEPPLALLLPTSKSCSFPESGQGQRTSLECQLTNPIIIGTEETVEVELDTSQLRDSLSSVEVKVAVSAEGIEATPDDTKLRLTLGLKADAKLILHGSNSEDQIQFKLDKKGKMDMNETKRIYHSFTLVKEGPTPLELVLFNIDIPVKFQDSEAFVAIYSPRANFMGQPVRCWLTGANFTVDPSEIKDTGLEIMDSESPITNKDVKRTKRSVGSESGRTMMADRTVELNCTNGMVECAQLTCQVNDWPSDISIAEISVQLGIDFSVLAGHLNTKLGGLFKTSAHAFIYSLNPDLTFTGTKTASAVGVTYLQPENLLGAGVPWWVILLAVLGGVLLLALLAFGLYKAGFFKRKELEELKAQKAQAEPPASAQGSMNPVEVKDK